MLQFALLSTSFVKLLLLEQVSKDVVTVSCMSYTGSIQPQHLQSSIQKYQAAQQVRRLLFLIVNNYPLVHAS